MTRKFQKSGYTVWQGVTMGLCFILDGLTLLLTFGKIASFFSSDASIKRLRAASLSFKEKRAELRRRSGEYTR